MKSANDGGMAKAAKKAPKKAPAKSNAKAKAPKKEAKSSKKPAVKATSVKTYVNAKSKTPVAKTNGKEVDKAAPEAKKGLFKKILSKMGVKGSSEKAKKAAKAKSRNVDEEFLPEPMDSGGEDLPDLGEFEENEELAEEEVEADTTDDDDDDDEAPIVQNEDEIYLTDAEGRRYCKVKECDQVSSVDGYCRFHYLLLWKRIQVRRKILVDGKLERYVEELTSRYPDKFLEMIRRDLKTEKDFQTAIAELEIDESANENEYEDEAQNFIDEVRGVTETGMSDEEEF